jgi:hypothetical protein
MEGGRGELCVDCRQRNALALRKGFDLAPALGDPFIEWKKPACEPHAQIAIEPALKRRSLRFIFIEKIDPSSNLTDRNDTQMQQLLGCCDDPVSNGTRGARLHQLRDDVRIEQITRAGCYHLIVLVESRLRVRWRSLPPGADWKNSTSDPGCRAISAMRSNSSARTTTTASPRCLTTRCGPSERTRRNNSLNCAFASWSCHTRGFAMPLD